jgi:threonine dehydrogenase-like Zn-dependent dehydrogenase
MSARDKPEPVVGPDEALVRVHSIGICGSDVHAFRGHHPYVTYPRVLGHELGVEILEAPANPRGLKAGDKVCVEPILECGVCYPCRQGRYNCCTSIRVLGIHTDGGMTEQMAVPVRRLHKPSVDLSYDELALCETLSIGVQAVKRARVESGEAVAVLGAGPIGLGILVAALARGARCLVSDPMPRNREIALAVGAEAVVDPTSEDLTGVCRDFGRGDGGVHAVIEAVGAAATIQQSIEIVAPTGRIVIVGISAEPVPIPINHLMRNEIEFLTTRNSCSAFDEVLQLFESHRDALGRMITDHHALEEGPAVIARLCDRRASGGVIKAVLHVD